MGISISSAHNSMSWELFTTLNNKRKFAYWIIETCKFPLIYDPPQKFPMKEEEKRRVSNIQLLVSSPNRHVGKFAISINFQIEIFWTCSVLTAAPEQIQKVHFLKGHESFENDDAEDNRRHPCSTKSNHWTQRNRLVIMFKSTSVDESFRTSSQNPKSLVA